MKKLWVIFTIFCLAVSITSVAQVTLDSTITTPGGLTVQYPSNYIGSADDDMVVGLVNPTNGLFLVIGAGDASFDFTGEEALNSVELKDGFVRLLGIFGGLMDDEPIQELSINDRSAFLIPFDASSIGRGYFLAFELTDGTPASVMLFGASGTEIETESVDELMAIASSLTIDASLAVTTDTTDGTEITTSVDADDVAEALELVDEIMEDDDSDTIPEGAIAIEDFPDGMILTGSGLQMSTLDDFTLAPGTEYVEDSLGLISNNFQNSILLIDLGRLSDSDRNQYINGVVPTIALMGGDEDFNAETDLQVIEVDERTITYYASPEFTEDDSGLALYYFFIDLLPEANLVTAVQVTHVNGDLDVFEPQLMEFIQSIQLTEEAIAEMNAPQAIECGTAGYDMSDGDSAFATVTCPAGCDSTSGTIWGTEIYTDDSSICVAALHMGVIDDMGGEVLVTYADGQSSYSSSELNGITSSEYGEWGTSFTVSVLESE
jgi:hypothetical protein